LPFETVRTIKYGELREGEGGKGGKGKKQGERKSEEY